MLGHPQTCPHGNPIDAETARRRPAGTPLSKVEAGEQATIYRITEEAEEDAGLLSYLEARALTPGAHVTILARSESLDSLTLEGPRGRATLGLRPAALVHVLLGEADPGCSTGCRQLGRSALGDSVRSRRHKRRSASGPRGSFRRLCTAENSRSGLSVLDDGSHENW